LVNHVASQGKTRNEAISNLQEALELYYEDEKYVPAVEKTLITTLEIVI